MKRGIALLLVGFVCIVAALLTALLITGKQGKTGSNDTQSQQSLQIKQGDAQSGTATLTLVEPPLGPLYYQAEGTQPDWHTLSSKIEGKVLDTGFKWNAKYKTDIPYITFAADTEKTKRVLSYGPKTVGETSRLQCFDYNTIYDASGNPTTTAEPVVCCPAQEFYDYWINSSKSKAAPTLSITDTIIAETIISDSEICSTSSLISDMTDEEKKALKTSTAVNGPTTPPYVLDELLGGIYHPQDANFLVTCNDSYPLHAIHVFDPVYWNPPRFPVFSMPPQGSRMKDMAPWNSIRWLPCFSNESGGTFSGRSTPGKIISPNTCRDPGCDNPKKCWANNQCQVSSEDPNHGYQCTGVNNDGIALMPCSMNGSDPSIKDGYFTKPVALMIKGPRAVSREQQLHACVEAVSTERTDIDEKAGDNPFASRNVMRIRQTENPYTNFAYFAARKKHGVKECDECNFEVECTDETHPCILDTSPTPPSKSARADEVVSKDSLAGRYNSLAYNCMDRRKTVKLTETHWLQDHAWKAGRLVSPGTEMSYTREYVQEQDNSKGDPVEHGYWPSGHGTVKKIGPIATPASDPWQAGSQPNMLDVRINLGPNDPHPDVNVYPPSTFLDFASQTVLRKNRFNATPSKDGGDVQWDTVGSFPPDNRTSSKYTPWGTATCAPESNSAYDGCAASNFSRFRYLTFMPGLGSRKETGRKSAGKTKALFPMARDVLIWSDYNMSACTKDNVKACKPLPRPADKMPWNPDDLPETQMSRDGTSLDNNMFQFYKVRHMLQGAEEDDDDCVTLKILHKCDLNNPLKTDAEKQQFVGVQFIHSDNKVYDPSNNYGKQARSKYRPPLADLQLFSTQDIGDGLRDLDKKKNDITQPTCGSDYCNSTIHTSFGFKESEGRAVLGLVGIVTYADGGNLQFKSLDTAALYRQARTNAKDKHLPPFFYDDAFVHPISWRLAEWNANLLGPYADSDQGHLYQLPIACIKLVDTACKATFQPDLCAQQLGVRMMAEIIDDDYWQNRNEHERGNLQKTYGKLSCPASNATDAQYCSDDNNFYIGDEGNCHGVDNPEACEEDMNTVQWFCVPPTTPPPPPAYKGARLPRSI